MKWVQWILYNNVEYMMKEQVKCTATNHTKRSSPKECNAVHIIEFDQSSQSSSREVNGSFGEILLLNRPTQRSSCFKDTELLKAIKKTPNFMFLG